MGKPFRKGVGSNQYADKAPSSLNPSQVDKVKQMAGSVVPQRTQFRTSLANEQESRKSTSQLIADAESSVGRYLDIVQDPTTTDQEIDLIARDVSRTEDAIYSRYQNSYGHSLVNAIYWSKKPLTPDNKQIKSDYDALLRDARDENARMSVDDLASTLDRVTKSENQWQDRVIDLKEDGTNVSLLSRHTALSIVSSRTSDLDPELKREMIQIQRSLNEKKVSQINL